MRILAVSRKRVLELERRARALSERMTESELKLWSALRGRRLGVQFRRQVVVEGRFIVDFAAPREKLAVEVDGGYHAYRRQADSRRDKLIGLLGWRVVRLPAEMVLREPSAAVERVREALAES